MTKMHCTKICRIFNSCLKAYSQGRKKMQNTSKATNSEKRNNKRQTQSKPHKIICKPQE